MEVEGKGRWRGRGRGRAGEMARTQTGGNRALTGARAAGPGFHGDAALALAQLRVAAVTAGVAWRFEGDPQARELVASLR